MRSYHNETIKEELDKRLGELEAEFKSDVIFIYAQMDYGMIKFFRDFIEDLKNDKIKNNTLTIILNTPGGSVEAVEKFVDIIRFHYKKVNFVVPDLALSAGTVFCLSGDEIFMDYSSSLGPIDPQVFTGNDWVPALGYLDQVEKFIEKSKRDELTAAEFAILQNQDLAMLSKYEQAKNLTITLIKDWLIKFKFKNWKIHSSTGKKVTLKEKENRAKEVADLLGDNKYWHSHGRLIGIEKIVNILKLKIQDFSKITELKRKIREYNELMFDYITLNKYKSFFHNRIFF